jgi:uncharacterized protein YdbL (DUF1318 family)
VFGTLLLAVLAGWLSRERVADSVIAGQLGEQVDGCLGIVAGGGADIRRLVEDLNIKRKAVYAQKAQEQHATVEDYAFTSGCLLISQTVPDEKYQAPDGTWKMRTTAPPIRDPRCP